jgi:hypothetical protein
MGPLGAVVLLCVIGAALTAAYGGAFAGYSQGLLARDVSDPLLRATLQSFDKARSTVLERIAALPPSLHVELATAPSVLEELRRYAGDLVTRATAISDQLRGHDRVGLQWELNQLRAAIEKTDDPLARREYENTVAVRLEQLDSYGELLRAYERTMAYLDRLVAVVEALPARLARLALVEGEPTDLYADVDEALERMRDELSASRQTARAARTLAELAE